METTHLNHNEALILKREWWWRKRAQYNLGLFLGGFIAFLFYCAFGSMITSHHDEFEMTLFTIAIQGLGYMAMVCIANLLYTLGSILDIVLNRNNNQQFRETLFTFGYWFSFALPVLIILFCILRFTLFGD